MSNVVKDLMHDIPGKFGTSDTYYPDGYDANDAFPSKERGAYFTTTEFWIPPYTGQSAVLLPPSFSLETWIQ